MKKIITGHLHHGPFQQHKPDGPWWVHGVMYTDDPDVIRRSRKNRNRIDDVDQVPAEHTAAVHAMKAEATHEVPPAVAVQDAAMADRLNYGSGDAA